MAVRMRPEMAESDFERKSIFVGFRAEPAQRARLDQLAAKLRMRGNTSALLRHLVMSYPLGEQQAEAEGEARHV